MNRERGRKQSIISVRVFEKVSSKIKEMILKGVTDWLIGRNI